MLYSYCKMYAIITRFKIIANVITTSLTLDQK